MSSAPPGSKPSPRMSPSQAGGKPAPVAAKPAPAAAEPAPVAAKHEPTHGVRMLRVRGKLADGREFLSSPTFLVPVDPASQGAK